MATDLKNSVLVKKLAPVRGHFLGAFGFSLFINLLMIVPALYMLQVFDRAVGSGSTPTLLMLTLIMVGLLAAMGALDWVRGQTMVRASAAIDKILAEPVFEASFRQSLRTGGMRSSPQSVIDLIGLRQFLAGPGLNAFFDTPWVPVYILIMFLFHTYFGLLALFCVALLGGLSFASQRMTTGNLSEANKQAMWANNYTTRNLRNAEVIESMGMIGDIRERWMQRNRQVVGLQAEASDTATAFTSSSKALRIMLQSLALGVGAYLAINLEISPGMMIAGSILLGRALAPVDQLVGAWKGLQNAREQFMRLDELLTKFPEDPERMELPAPRGALSVEKISVLPPGGATPVLRGVDFELPAGTSLAVIGPSAAGKSSLLRAILGLWPVTLGAVRLDGASMDKWDRGMLGPYLGYLPQDIELFDGSISENIARFGEIDSEKVVTAARLAGVHEMVLRLPEGYDTVIGQSGGALSAGQRQRVGLARAVYGQPKLVVLDEPNSNLDDLGEAALREALLSLKALGSTLIIVSHRPSVLSVVDKILILREGQVVDFGNAEAITRRVQQASVRRPAALTQTVSVPG